MGVVNHPAGAAQSGREDRDVLVEDDLDLLAEVILRQRRPIELLGRLRDLEFLLELIDEMVMLGRDFELQILSVAGVRDRGRQEQINPEWLVGQRADLGDHAVQLVGRVSGRADHAKATGFGNGGGERRTGGATHPGKDHRDLDAQHVAEFSLQRGSHTWPFSESQMCSRVRGYGISAPGCAWRDPRCAPGTVRETATRLFRVARATACTPPVDTVSVLLEVVFIGWMMLESRG